MRSRATVSDLQKLSGPVARPQEHRPAGIRVSEHLAPLAAFKSLKDSPCNITTNCFGALVSEDGPVAFGDEREVAPVKLSTVSALVIGVADYLDRADVAADVDRRAAVLLLDAFAHGMRKVRCDLGIAVLHRLRMGVPVYESGDDFVAQPAFSAEELHDSQLFIEEARRTAAGASLHSSNRG